MLQAEACVSGSYIPDTAAAVSGVETTTGLLLGAFALDEAPLHASPAIDENTQKERSREQDANIDPHGLNASLVTVRLWACNG